MGREKTRFLSTNPFFGGGRFAGGRAFSGDWGPRNGLFAAPENGSIWAAPKTRQVRFSRARARSFKRGVKNARGRSRIANWGDWERFLRRGGWRIGIPLFAFRQLIAPNLVVVGNLTLLDTL